MIRVFLFGGGMLRENECYTLKRARPTLKQILLFIVTFPISIARWIFSLLVGPIVTNLALNPFNIRNQRQVHCLTDNDPEVIVNVLPRKSYKLIRDLFFKAQFMISWIMGWSSNPRALRPYTPQNLKHMDHIVSEIVDLRRGQSKAKHCKEREFAWDNIHIKGLDGFDSRLQAHFWDALQCQSGINQDTPHQSLFDFFTLKTTDGSILDSVEVLGPGEKEKDMGERRFIVNCLARDKNFITQLTEYRRTAESLGCTMVGFNYRGVCYSEGLVWTQDNMVNDTIAQVHRLIVMGAQSKHICLDGHCIGGAVATLAAGKLRQQGYDVKVANDRSFQTLPGFLGAMMLPDPSKSLLSPITLFRYALGGVVYASMWAVLFVCRWEMNAGKAWTDIPQKDKTFIVAHNMQNDGKLSSDDGIVHSWVTIAALEKNQGKANVFIPRRSCETTDPSEDIDVNREAHHISWRKNLVQAYPTGQRLTAEQFLHHREVVMLGLKVKNGEPPPYEIVRIII